MVSWVYTCLETYQIVLCLVCQLYLKKAVEKERNWAIKGQRYWESGIACYSSNFRMGMGLLWLFSNECSHKQRGHNVLHFSVSFCFFWIISASFTDKLVFTLNNGEIIYSGCKVVKCIQLCFLHHLVNHQLGLNFMCYCWGSGGRIYKSGLPSWLYCQSLSWACSVRAQIHPAVVGNWEWGHSYHV